MAKVIGFLRNMHVPQSLVSANELREIAAVPYQIMSPRECKPIIGVVQDTALGVYRMTKEYVLMDDKAFFNLMARNSLFTGILPTPAEEVDGVRRWSGRQALSSIIPKNINIKSPNRSFDDNVPGGDKENFVIVQNGEIVQGRVDASIYQNRTKGLIHSIYNECGADETRKFFDNTQTMICDFLVNNGFSVGISDLVVDDKDKEELKKVIHDMKVKVYDIIRNIHMGHFENKSIENNNDYFEQEVNQILNQANTKAGKLGMAKIDDATNRMINMVKSGSKGNVINVAQMLACLGQQNVDGKRIVYGFDSRTLPHYTKYDDGPESRGFVENSFVQGLSPQEFFFHAMGGREGLIDTAVRTSESGYLQRKLVKAMEDCKIAHDSTVRNASGSIVQFLYGEDGMNPTKIESQSLPYIEMDYATLCKEYLIAPEDDLKYILNDQTIKELKGVDGWEDRMRGHFEKILDDREFMIERIFHNQRDNSILYPVSFARIINTSKMMFSGKGVLSDLNPLYVLDKVEELCKELVVGGHFNPGNKLIQILIRCFLSPKQMVCVNKFDKMIFDYIYSQVKAKFFEAINDPSDMVGVIAAQSIGEPISQMSTHATQIVRVRIFNKKTSQQTFYNGQIGKLIDGIHDEYNEYVVDVPDHHDSTVIPMKHLDKEIYIVGVSDDEKTSWKKVSEVSRHPANGGLLKITTRSGKSTTATLSHSFLKRTESKIVPIKGSDLKVGDRVPVAKYTPMVENAMMYYEVDGDKVDLDFDFGWLCGAYIADGSVNGNKVTITKSDMEVANNIQRIIREKWNLDMKRCEKRGTINVHPAFKDKEYVAHDNSFTSRMCAKIVSTFGVICHEKIVAPWVFGANRKFIRGVISGYFDGDGNVQTDNRSKNMIRSGSTSEKLTEDMIVLLSYVGIFASKCLEKKNKKIYGDKCMDLHTIQIPGKYCHLFKKKIGFATGYKQQDLLKMIDYFDREDKHAENDFIDKIPELGEAIAFIGKTLALPGQSRNYGRWKKKEAIGRRTLQKYIKIFEEENAKQQNKEVAEKIKILRQAANSDVIWDEIVDIEYLPDPKEYVYDFTVPGNDSFVVDTNIIVHNTLNTFHSSGVSSASKAVRGVPRVKELLSVSKNQKTPSLRIHLKPDIAMNKNKAKEIMNTIQTTLFADIVKSSKIYYDPDDFKTTIEDDAKFVNSYREFVDRNLVNTTNNPWLLRFEFDKEKMLDYSITMLDVHAVLQDHFDNNIITMFSDDNADQLIFRIRLPSQDPPKKGAAAADEDGNEKDYITELKALEKSIMENLIVKGIKKIHKAALNKQEYSKYNKETMQFEKTFEWVIETAGANFIDVLGHNSVDPYKTMSNDIIEVYELFGIEAARQALFHELDSVIKDGQLYINYRHIGLLVDTMTNRGYLMSIDRHGINRVDIGPLAKCSFEEVTDMLTKAGMFAEIDRITGISANVILGQIPQCGTGDTQIVLDHDKVIALSKDTTIKISMDDVREDPTIINYCAVENLTFDFTLPDPDPAIKKLKLPQIKVV